MTRRTSPPVAVAAAALALLASACQLTAGTDPVGSGTPSKVIPVATSPGVPQGPTLAAVIGVAGGAFDAGGVELLVPPGSAEAGTLFTVTPISSRAPGALGASYRIESNLPLRGSVQIRFHGLGYYAAGLSVRSLTVRYQDARGYWLEPDAVVVDAAADTVTATSSHLSDWTMVLGSPPELEGTFTLDQAVGIPFQATGTAALYAIPGRPEPNYYLTGTITIPPQLTQGTRTCVPDAQTKDLDLSLAEIHDGVFHWGLNGLWLLTCTDSATGAVSTVDLGTMFDTMRINLIRCPGQFIGTQVNGTGYIQGKYTSDCGPEGYVTGTWDYRGCTPGGSCLMANPCVLGIVTCSGSVGSCSANGFAPLGTECGSGLTCDGAGTCR